MFKQVGGRVTTGQKFHKIINKYAYFRLHSVQLRLKFSGIAYLIHSTDLFIIHSKADSNF
jgi:hypothetical protein